MGSSTELNSACTANPGANGGVQALVLNATTAEYANLSLFYMVASSSRSASDNLQLASLIWALVTTRSSDILCLTNATLA